MNCSDGNCELFDNKVIAAKQLFSLASEAVKSGEIAKPNLIWLELTGCAGNVISMLDGAEPSFEGLLSELCNVVFDNSLMASQGDTAMRHLMDALNGPFILAVEGAVSLADGGSYTVVGSLDGQSLNGYDAIKLLGERAELVFTVGTCASSGGISAAAPNPSQSVPIQDVLTRPVIKLPGCPCHPDWFIGTLAYAMLYGTPPLDEYGRPYLFYSTLIHDFCPRRPFFDQGIFAKELGEATCMLKMGCRGPITRSSCPFIQWNVGVNWPIGNNTPCIGCAMFGFPDYMEPFVSFNVTQTR